MTTDSWAEQYGLDIVFLYVTLRLKVPLFGDQVREARAIG